MKPDTSFGCAPFLLSMAGGTAAAIYLATIAANGYTGFAWWIAFVLMLSLLVPLLTYVLLLAMNLPAIAQAVILRFEIWHCKACLKDAIRRNDAKETIEWMEELTKRVGGRQP